MLVILSLRGSLRKRRSSLAALDLVAEVQMSVLEDVAVAMASTGASAPPFSPSDPPTPPGDLCALCGHAHPPEENHEYLYRDEVDDDLVCHICLQPLTRPVDTPCGHTYCRECLTCFLLESDFCPVCRAGLMLQSCRASSLLVHKLLDKLSVAYRDK
ncbi:Ligand of Numb protein X 2 [Liparis tanakae]|uniref:Ligand of Numb protein X 2 n=1 Tax=Liparis tanakae TaxID=230148 RepID=A0A4Z2FFG3_9TELE|nr:Ligand of Numb protein X 2 [Liparis tanakae]